ncbi:hypothetical protein A3H83_00525 [Candidatus Roizmanbacteria bacterium RIFCSPLOWO2_02_FULL_39_8]|uniref:Ribonucleoside-diphosphate reductase n=1 Tax=Candidatus Daviesbacteria bacterium RIFCSPHIGHO2_12_FULL_43_11 TaxID=1797780 RepID=A0A1F5K3N2_9BACT|nr:MAG: hypothetical protein A3E45_00075 [Candidatus Daviesbacteria bacterium RIFCSPHIGHO2_12_FULL_43_11]OGK56874.1 MAG: hypothetical protein A3H83_00525 [Candidatus Roizmanbacteria bacterium RIFCSPLOWO2_02_FULL_39_8]
MKEYQPTPYALSVLQKGRILAPEETPQQMFDRVVASLFAVESVWNTDPAITVSNQRLFADLMADKAVSPGTPTLTNVGRPEYSQAALSSCVVIPVDLRQKDEAAIKIRSYYRQNMGSGFDFTPYEDPIGILTWLNDFSAAETATGEYDRYIGNMGNLAVFHPQIREFIKAKKERSLPHFNISVDVNEEFMDAANQGKPYRLADGTEINASELLWQMAECAQNNGDPGIIYLDRMNRDNPIAELSPYTSTPPCSEMGLASGETCQFGYINLAKFAAPEGISWDKLTDATMVMTRILDNAIQISCGGYPDPESLRLANLKRKIGIGVCGLADMFLAYDLPYDSEEARQFARNVLSVINYSSKLASVALAEERGSCGAMTTVVGNRYYDGFLESKYSGGTELVSGEMWRKLGQRIRNTRMLRNILTTSLPPTGRASILMGAVSGIEPIFGVSTWNGDTRTCIKRFLEHHANDRSEELLAQAITEGSFQGVDLEGRECLKTATEISPFDHIRMVGALVGKGGVYDEAASKTINLPRNATPRDVLDIFLFAHELGLKNISVYRDGAHINQPQKL